MRALPGRSTRATSPTPPASVTRSSAYADQRRRILRAIAELVAERGYSEVTVELIVKRARCSFKTFYKHHSSKEDCFVALFDSAVSSAERTIRERVDSESLPWAQQVALAVRTLFELIAEEPTVARAVIVDSRLVGPAIVERYEECTRAFVPLFRAGRDHNPRGAELPESIEETLAGAVFWSAYQRLVVGEADELPSDTPVLVELILRTYLGQAEAGRVARAEGAGRHPVLA